jgi:hypothetical protein
VSLTSSSYEFAHAIKDALDADKTTLGLQAVYYGEQNKIPVTPVAMVDPGPLNRQLQGAPYRTPITMQVFVLVLNNKIEDKETMFQDTDQLVANVDAFLNGQTYGGIVIFSFVSDIEPGYSQRGAALYRATRLTITAQSLQQLTKS